MKTTKNRGFWNALLNRHSDGSKHVWVKRPEESVGWHSCWDYCHHYVQECRECGDKSIGGYSVEEVR